MAPINAVNNLARILNHNFRIVSTSGAGISSVLEICHRNFTTSSTVCVDKRSNCKTYVNLLNITDNGTLRNSKELSCFSLKNSSNNLAVLVGGFNFTENKLTSKGVYVLISILLGWKLMVDNEINAESGEEYNIGKVELNDSFDGGAGKLDDGLCTDADGEMESDKESLDEKSQEMVALATKGKRDARQGSASENKLNTIYKAMLEIYVQKAIAGRVKMEKMAKSNMELKVIPEKDERDAEDFQYDLPTERFGEEEYRESLNDKLNYKFKSLKQDFYFDDPSSEYDFGDCDLSYGEDLAQMSELKGELSAVRLVENLNDFDLEDFQSTVDLKSAFYTFQSSLEYYRRYEIKLEDTVDFDELIYHPEVFKEIIKEECGEDVEFIKPLEGLDAMTVTDRVMVVEALQDSLKSTVRLCKVLWTRHLSLLQYFKRVHEKRFADLQFLNRLHPSQRPTVIEDQGDFDEHLDECDSRAYQRSAVQEYKTLLKILSDGVESCERIRSGLLKMGEGKGQEKIYKQMKDYKDKHNDLLHELHILNSHTVELKKHIERKRAAYRRSLEQELRNKRAKGGPPKEESPVVFRVPFNRM